MIKAIVAIDKKTNGIGFQNKLPWKLKSDLQFFKEMTLNGILVMGWNTMLSLGKPLPNRNNIVIVNEEDTSKIIDGFTILYKKQAIELLKLISENKENVWVIGGAKTYEFFKNIIDEWYVVEIFGEGKLQFDTYLDLNLDNYRVDMNQTAVINEICLQPQDEHPKYIRVAYTKKTDVDESIYTPLNTCPKLAKLANRYKTDFIDIFGKIIDVVCDKNIYKGEYHSTHHLVGTAYLAFIFSAAEDKSYADINFRSLNPVMFNRYTRRTIVRTLSMLFHDYCYLGEKDDKLNIEHSKTKMREFFKIHNRLFSNIENELKLPISKMVDYVGANIDYTFYDFDNPCPAAPIAHNKAIDFIFLRDIDQMYASIYFDEDMFDRLYNDIGKRFYLTYNEFLKRNINYITELEINTPYFKKVFSEIFPSVIIKHNEISYLKNL